MHFSSIPAAARFYQLQHTWLKVAPSPATQDMQFGLSQKGALKYTVYFQSVVQNLGNRSVLASCLDWSIEVKPNLSHIKSHFDFSLLLEWFSYKVAMV